MAAGEEEVSWGEGWGVGLRAWVERKGKAVLGSGRLELLEGIDRWHSISATARHMGMSYRRAWLLVQAVNEAAGRPLVVTAKGGEGGGGAELTPLGRRAAAVFRELYAQLHATAAAVLPRLVRPPGAAALHVAAAVSLEEVLGRLLADYTLRRPAVRVRAIFGASDELADHLVAGAPGDVFLSADEGGLEQVGEADLLEPESRTALARNGLVVIGAPGARGLRRATELARPEVGRVALAEQSCPLGRYSRQFLSSAGLEGTLAGRVVVVDNSRAVVDAVRARRADVGVAYASDVFRSPDCRLLLRLRWQRIRYWAGVLRRSPQAAEARGLVHFLASAAAAARFRQCGFLPLAPRTRRA